MVKKQETKYDWYFSKFKCKRQCKRDVFSGWNAWIIVRLIYLEALKLEQRYGWYFWGLSDSMKSKSDSFSSCKQTSKVYMYLEVKLHQGRRGWWIYKFRCLKTIEIKYLEASNHRTQCHCCFWMLKCLRKGKNGVFRRCK